MKRRFAAAVVAALLVTMLSSVDASASATCTISATGKQGILVNGFCVPGKPIDSRDATSAETTKIVLCGRTWPKDPGWNSACGAPVACYQQGRARTLLALVDAYATFIYQGGRWVLGTVWCPAHSRPAPSLAALRDQVLRLLPHVAVGVAWKDTALVNAETVLWAATQAHRDLGAVTVVGQRVQLRISFARAQWDFGDGTTATTTSPGKAYTDADPCTTAQCADYYGHTYRATGDRTITLTVSWNAQFSLDGGRTWAAVDPGALQGPPATHTLTVEQARGILVPDP